MMLNVRVNSHTYKYVQVTFRADPLKIRKQS